MRYRGKVSGVVIDKEGRFLIVQLASYGENRWNFPGGGVENGEAEKEAILQELKEELGTNKFEIVRQASYVGKYEWPHFVIAKKLANEGRTLRGQRVKYFLIRFLGEDGDIKSDSSEVKSVKWIGRGKLKSHLIFPGQQ